MSVAAPSPAVAGQPAAARAPTAPRAATPARCPCPLLPGRRPAARRRPAHAPVVPSAGTELVNSLAADVTYLGLASALVAVSGAPLLKAGGVSPTSPDATRKTPTAAFILSSLISFLPLVNWAAWLLLMVTEGPKKRYWAYAAMYALPFVLTASGAGEVLALEAAALCALHFQVERLALAAVDAAGARVAGGGGGGPASEWDAAAAALEADADAAALEAFDARLGARLARGPRLRLLAAAAGVPRAKSGRVDEVKAGLEDALADAERAAGGAGALPRSGSAGRRGAAVVAASSASATAGGERPSWRDALVAEAQAALEKEGGRSRRRRSPSSRSPSPSPEEEMEEESL